jgi:NAD(P)-dependent dehydrogenase (short-subunit alcohol dehydrogenase family)
VSTPTTANPIALVTGGSRGLGRALVEELNRRGWLVITDGRDPSPLSEAVAATSAPERVWGIPGDIADSAHRAALAEAVSTGDSICWSTTRAPSAGALRRD